MATLFERNCATCANVDHKNGERKPPCNICSVSWDDDRDCLVYSEYVMRERWVGAPD